MTDPQEPRPDPAVAPAIGQAIDLHREGRLEEADALYRVILELAPWEVDVVVRRSVLLAQQGALAEAEGLLRKVIEREPRSTALYGALAAVQAQAGKLDRTLDSLNRAISINATDPELLAAAAVLQSIAGADDKAMAAAAKAVELAPKSATYHWIFADVLAVARHLPEAVKEYDQALWHDPKLASIYVKRGNVLVHLAKAKDAIESYRQALALVPDSFAARFGLASVLHQLGRAEDAEPAYMAALATEAPERGDLLELGRRRQLAGKLAETFALFRDAHAPIIDHGEAYKALSSLYAALERWPEAHAATRNALSTPPFRTRTCTDREIGRVLCLISAEDRVFRRAEGEWHLGSIVNHGKRLDPNRFTIHVGFATKRLADDLKSARPVFDLVFNSIVEPDTAASDLTIAETCLKDMSLPVINPPERVAAARPDMVREGLAAIPNLKVPRTLRVDLNQILIEEVSSQVAKAGLAYPVVVREVGALRKFGLEVAETPSDLADIMDDVRRDVVYVADYIENRRPDGMYACYRAFSIDGALYPSSLVISDYWAVRTRDRLRRMATNEALRDEERRFLADPVARIGRAAHAALESVHAAVGLDCFGIDFALLETGEAVVFAASANMSFNPGRAEPFPYLEDSFRAVTDAVNGMVERRLGEFPPPR